MATKMAEPPDPRPPATPKNNNPKSASGLTATSTWAGGSGSSNKTVEKMRTFEEILVADKTEQTILEIHP